MSEEQDKLRASVVARTAYKRGRRAFPQILEIIPFVVDCLAVILMCLEEEFHHIGYPVRSNPSQSLPND